MAAIRPPTQRRSRETLTRLLGAARELLEEKSFNELSINEIVERAGSSVGAFYARFADKEALLEALAASVAGETAEEALRLEKSKNWRLVPLEAVVAEFVGVLVRQHRAHRGTLRALIGRCVAGGGSAASAGAVLPLPLVELLRDRRGEISHPDPDVAARLGLAMAVSAVRERVLFPEISPCSPSAAPVTDAVFVEELSRAVIGFLGVRPPRRAG